MKPVTPSDLKDVYIPPPDSHKGQNGRLLIIGGSHLFHAASLWALEVASRIVDLVHYSSVPENNELVEKIKSEFRDGIVIPRNDIDAYIEEDDAILIGPGMTRDNETKELTDTLLKKYPHKQWVIDAGALQMMDTSLIPKNAILTPHHGEFEGMLDRENAAEVAPVSFPRTRESINGIQSPTMDPRPRLNRGQALRGDDREKSGDDKNTAQVEYFAKQHECIILLKGQQDIVCSSTECRMVEGGNSGMTKGGTGDVLAGLVAALACKNNPFTAAIAGSFINKKAGDTLYKTVGPFFNASDLARQIPLTMNELLFS